jgi:hypothetical protein
VQHFESRHWPYANGGFAFCRGAIATMSESRKRPGLAGIHRDLPHFDQKPGHPSHSSRHASPGRDLSPSRQKISAVSVKPAEMGAMVFDREWPFRDEARFDCELKMTVHAPKLLTPEEFASLIEIAITSPSPTVPALHLTKLIGLGYVIVTARGHIVTGDGLIRITESE